MQKISKNTKDTEKIAEEFLAGLLRNTKKHKNAVIVGLSGDLGSGKTFFTQTVGRLLGIKNHINSPTFVIMKKYPINQKFNGFRNDIKKKLHTQLFHMDAYRLKNEKELKYLGWKEIISDPLNLIFIEWPENIVKSIPKKYHRIFICHTKEGHRKFKIKNI